MFDYIIGLILHWEVFFGCIGAYLGYYFYSTWQLRKSLPPGPWPLPIFGNMLMLRGPGSTRDKFVDLAKRYGDPMSFWLGNKLSIVLSSKNTVRDVLITQQNNFCSRQDSITMDLAFEGAQDIALAKYGPLWLVHRKLASRSLRSVVDASSLEEQVQEAINVTAKLLMETKGPISIHEYLVNTVFNVICSFAYGKMYEMDDPEFIRLMYLSRELNEGLADVMVFDFIPGAKYLPLKKFPAVKKNLDLTREMRDILYNKIKEHRMSFSDDITRDFIDSMIKEQNSLLKEGEKDAEQLTDGHLTWIVLDFFSAGTDTTSTTLTWLFLYLVLDPEIQERCYQDISREIGDESPKLSDRKSLPFVEACIMESLRMRPAAPMGLPHVNISEARLGVYTVPAGTIATPIISQLHLNKNGEFGDSADQFAPSEHFLESDGVTLKKPASFLPFGAGKRVCLGEQLAKNDLFLIVTSLLQKFKFLAVDGEEYSTDPDVRYDILSCALPYRVLVKRRQ